MSGGHAEFRQDETGATITLYRPSRNAMISEGVIPMLRGVMTRLRDAGFHGLIQIGSLMSEGTSGNKVQANIPCPSEDNFKQVLSDIEAGLIAMNELPGEASLIIRLRLIGRENDNATHD